MHHVVAFYYRALVDAHVISRLLMIPRPKKKIYTLDIVAANVVFVRQSKRQYWLARVEV